MDLGVLAPALLLAIFAAIPLSVTVWALLDAARRPQWAWALAGRSQVAWMAVIMFAAFTLIGGLLVSSWYLTRIRHEIADAEDGRI
ncbi:MAG: hypothetical protein ACT4OV_07520 [Microthrixaceae bacterium]